VDVFVIPAAGGVPKRLTWHPSADRVLGWTPDGKRIILSSARFSYSRFDELFTMPADGGVEEKLPLPSGYQASMSPDGESVAYEPTGKAFPMWKRYRGGQTARIWLARLSDSTITKVPRTNSNDFNPMWAGDRVFFLSDRNGPVTLFSYDVKTKNVREAIPNQGLDLKSATLGPEAIVYLAKKGIRCVATDGPSLGGVDPRRALMTYWALGSRGMVGIEFLTNVRDLPEKAFFVFAPVKIQHCHGGPGRAIALY
jgi:tricorn protease